MSRHNPAKEQRNLELLTAISGIPYMIIGALTVAYEEAVIGLSRARARLHNTDPSKTTTYIPARIEQGYFPFLKRGKIV